MSTEQILELKQELRLSPKEFASRYGVSRRQFYNWIQKKSIPAKSAQMLMYEDLQKIISAKKNGAVVLLINRN